MPSINSLDDLLASAADNGVWARTILLQTTAASVAGNTTSGYSSAQRCARTVSVPSVGTGLSGMYVTRCRMTNTTSDAVRLCALEYLLGTLTFSSNTGTFTNAGSMPTKTPLGGSSVQTATIIPVISIGTTLAGATTPTITTTYVNQAGTGSRSVALTFPSNPTVGSVYMVSPHLQSGDTGVQSVSAMVAGGSITSGVMNFYGLLPIAWSAASNVGGAGASYGPDPFQTMQPIYKCEQSLADYFAFYRFTKSANVDSVDTLVEMVGIAT